MENRRLPREILDLIFSAGVYADDIRAFCAADKAYTSFCDNDMNWYMLLKKRILDLPSPNNPKLKDVVFEKAYLQLDELERTYGEALWAYLNGEYDDFVGETIEKRRMIDLAVCVDQEMTVGLFWGSNNREGRILRRAMQEKPKLEEGFLRILEPGVVDIFDEGWRSYLETKIQEYREDRSPLGRWNITEKLYEQMIYIAALYDDVEGTLDLIESMFETDSDIDQQVRPGDFIARLVRLLISRRKEVFASRISRYL